MLKYEKKVDNKTKNKLPFYKVVDDDYVIPEKYVIDIIREVKE